MFSFLPSKISVPFNTSGIRKACVSLLVTVSLPACSSLSPGKISPTASVPRVTLEAAPEWQQIVSLADRERLKGIEVAWSEALGEAHKRGFRKAVLKEGKLLQPAAGQLLPAPSPGNYLCRLIQLGGTLKRQRPFSAAKPAFCYVGVNEDGKLWIDQQTGPQQISGLLLHDENQRRMVFLGARKTGRAQSLPTYEEAGAQQAAGVFERVGALRYRLVIPRPESKYKLELLELTPAAIQLDS